MKLGSRFKRFIAFMLDSLALYILCTILLPLLPIIDSYLLVAILSLIYFIAFERSKYQATLGKIFLKLYVADPNDNRVSVWKALLRFILGVFAPFFFIVCAYIALVSFSLSLETDSMDLLAFAGACVVTAPFMIPLLVWFIPIFFKSRRGMYEKISGTVVLRR